MQEVKRPELYDLQWSKSSRKGKVEAGMPRGCSTKVFFHFKSSMSQKKPRKDVSKITKMAKDFKWVEIRVSRRQERREAKDSLALSFH